MARSGIAPWTAHQDETRGFQKVFSAARSTVDSASRGQAILGRAEQCRIRTGILVDPEEVTLRRLTLNDHRPNIDRHCTLLVHALNRRRRPEPTWLDRLGRGIGYIWLLLMLVGAGHFSVFLGIAIE